MITVFTHSSDLCFPTKRFAKYGKGLPKKKFNINYSSSTNSAKLHHSILEKLLQIQSLPMGRKIITKFSDNISYLYCDLLWMHSSNARLGLQLTYLILFYDSFAFHFPSS